MLWGKACVRPAAARASGLLRLERFDAQAVGVEAKARYHAEAGRREELGVTKSLAAVHVAQVHLNHGHVERT